MQYISLITLGITDIARSRRFYGEGFGWTPVFHNDDVTFYQMNGFVFGTWLTHMLADDMQRQGLSQTGPILSRTICRRRRMSPP